MRRGQLPGALAAAGGLVAAGVGAGLALRRALISQELGHPDPYADEALGQLPGTVRAIAAEDGVPLHVLEGGRADAELTVVFVHGYVLSTACWHFQWRALADRARLVGLDQRGHGGSGRGARETATIDQLGRDLAVVLDAVVPTGPVVLVGHSMGGMTIMALADQRPEWFGSRIRGVALISTSAGRLAEVSLGLPAGIGAVAQRVVPWAIPRLGGQASLIDRRRQAGGTLGYWLTKRYSFGSDVSPTLVAFMQQMLNGTPFDVIADFYPAFDNHDKFAALGVLAGVETLILAGDRDLLTPADHSRDIARMLPGAQLLIVANTGHMVVLEQPGVVNQALEELVDRVEGRAAYRSSA